MFRWLFLYWYNSTDTPSAIAKVNLWSYINLRLFKARLSSSIAYYILGLNNLELKKLKIFYKNTYFDYIYLKSIPCLFLIIFFTNLYLFL
uniref:Ymf70 n=1 Tax=Tetrahymena thermophila TaxID=5911 RepID=Q950Y0_TETTH|nr:ymf70 [Tetrahymena thermophila]8B6H_ES Chain ES, Ymf70 [Tetrahymena thermophila SB210]8B6H_Es Chain Es, Ymf70 [Tetrahymena thermophila SB210]8BQS_ES Chain ES, Ymf70 [Tetrahymena thermophila SB210]8BQS_Es Chain Es, Ymf70 [Tetrahymena thermophila SB210]8GYM_Y0 Chain Y0, Ymf70 [Tetrahymena thermophila SB210]8GYM_y0 Chain y0, Ymf70 [Tetrahymena thermophila SB210]8GZU_0G Chain 0G, Ymf70 [Tetrahymena thermophila SB210]8GZU_51 Chain 51, Ymf70 [Tetrahymena thermophila SB210]8GZU_Y0 Chain Y0, Ym